jgi:predicted nucleic acid-binding protein
MPETVVDTTPLNYLISIDAVDILPTLYGTIWIPIAVNSELLHPKAPERVREWIRTPPSWLQIKEPAELQYQTQERLGPGERQAISLALALPSTLLIIDDRDAVNVARKLGIPTVGTLGVLDHAAARNLIKLPIMLQRLQKTTFRAPARLVTLLLKQDADRESKDK